MESLPSLEPRPRCPRALRPQRAQVEAPGSRGRSPTNSVRDEGTWGSRSRLGNQAQEDVLQEGLRDRSGVHHLDAVQGVGESEFAKGLPPILPRPNSSQEECLRVSEPESRDAESLPEPCELAKMSLEITQVLEANQVECDRICQQALIAPDPLCWNPPSTVGTNLSSQQDAVFVDASHVNVCAAGSVSPDWTAQAPAVPGSDASLPRLISLADFQNLGRISAKESFRPQEYCKGNRVHSLMPFNKR